MRFSHQRELVLNLVKEFHNHPTADVIYESARKIEPDISLGTVYRNLKQLVESGLLTTVETSDKSLHYDADVSTHTHFVCEKCGKIFDFYSKVEPPTEITDSGMEIRKEKLVYYGICQDCRKIEKN